MCASAINQAKSDLQINSPSKVFEELGGYTAEGFGVGYEKKISEVNNMIRDSCLLYTSMALIDGYVVLKNKYDEYTSLI